MVPIPEFTSVVSAYTELTKTQWLSPEQLEQAQLQQINNLLQHSYDNSPYYRLMLDQCGIGRKPITSFQEFRKIPLLTRKKYQDHYSSIKVSKLPEGMIPSPSPIHTSGTNGTPISLYKTDRDNLWWQAMAMRDFEWGGMDPMKRMASIRLIGMNKSDYEIAVKGISIPTWLPKVHGYSVFKCVPVHGMDIRQDPKVQLTWLRTVNPNYLISMPSNLEVLADLVEESGRKLPDLETIQTIGETLTPQIKERLERTFGAKVVNLYSANETGYIASSCPTGNGLHIHAESVYVEVLNEQNNPCKPGETGKLVVTSLTNFINPFIRYDIIDEVTLANEPCSCGRGLPLLKHINGRRHPMLFLAGNRRKVSTGIMLGIRQIGGVRQFQVIQHNIDNFTLRVVPNKEWTDEHGLKMIQCIQEEVESTVHVDIKKSEVIERPNGKLKIIVVEPENINAK